MAIDDMLRNIAVVTGTRSEYGILNPVMKAIKGHSGLELSLVVTGMHLSHEFGYTAREIEKDGFTIDARVDMLLSSDTSAAMAKSIGLGILGMAQTWEQLKPDVILVLGDRVEPLAAAVAGAYMNIPVAHIHGGDNPRAGLDEYARHAITKLSHIHFPATQSSAERIIRMGEDPWRVHMVGSPTLDSILGAPLLSSDALSMELSFNISEPLILAVQHPVTTQPEQVVTQIKETLEAIKELGHQTVLIYPNSDAGGRAMIGVIKEYEHFPFIKTFQSLPHQTYLSLMLAASVMVGNSSSGIIEAPSFGLPAVNIGIRQEGRERGKNVIDVGYNKREIVGAIQKALTDQVFLPEVKKCRNPYGDGKAGPRIAEILSQIEITPKLLEKKIAY
ncbi:MAG: UDP-N-acetylglucosamine 2-epimerase [Dehalococcoidia bacterium]|nr:UDP-N-acetylglucosamine 2-epimerase [Dehalococcoidia bacterium]